MTAAVQMVATDAPGGVDKLVTFHVERGKMKSITLEEKPAPSDFRTMPLDLTKYLLRGTAPYETHCALHRREFPLMQALEKEFKVEGDMTKIMGKMGEFVQFLDVQCNIPAQY